MLTGNLFLLLKWKYPQFTSRILHSVNWCQCHCTEYTIVRVTLMSQLSSCSSFLRAGLAQSILWLATGWAVRGSDFGRDEFFRIRPDRSCGPPSFVYKGYRDFSPGVKRQWYGVNHHPTPSSTNDKEIVELYVYFPSRPSSLVLGWNFTSYFFW
jgi:hypothetical protein